MIVIISYNRSSFSEMSFSGLMFPMTSYLRPDKLCIRGTNRGFSL